MPSLVRGTGPPPWGVWGVVLLALLWKVEQCLCFLLSFPPPPF